MSEICFGIGNHPLAECRGKCCYEDGCNKANILDTSGQDSSKNSGKPLVNSDNVLGLFFGLLLAVVSVNY